MKRFVLSEMMLLSQQEKKAKQIIFHPTRTLILGSNSTGKSSLLKSIYQAFGATPKNIHPTWKQIDPIAFVKFKIDEQDYSILRYGKSFTVFDSVGQRLGNFDKITSGLAPYFSTLFDFKIKLNDKNSQLSILPPAYLFLPFYIDQDSSWSENWNSFSNLTQFSAWREDLISYHIGLKPNEYYEAKSERDKLKDELKVLESERNTLRNLLKKVKGSLDEASFDIDIDIFKDEINELLVELDKLNKLQEQLKAKLADFYNTKFHLAAQIKITEAALSESIKDYKYILTEAQHGIDCPTCGQHYEGSFAERFSIAQDEERCNELLFELRKEIEEVDQKIKKENEKYTSTLEEIVRINEILERKQGEIKLKDVIEKEGKKELSNIFALSIAEITARYNKNAGEIADKEKALKGFENKDRRSTIMSDYMSFMKKFLWDLDVHSLREEHYKDVAGKIKETGSNLPRALIAYYFSIFNVIGKHSTSCFCPIIVDSPNQQAQDQVNLKKILNFIKDNQPDNTQLILGLEDAYDVDFNCDVVKLSEKYSLLQKDEYEKVHEEMRPIINKSFESNLGGLF